MLRLLSLICALLFTSAAWADEPVAPVKPDPTAARQLDLLPRAYIERLELHLDVLAAQSRESRHLSAAFGFGVGAAGLVMFGTGLHAPSWDTNRGADIALGAALAATEFALSAYQLGTTPDEERLADDLHDSDAAEPRQRSDAARAVESRFAQLAAQDHRSIVAPLVATTLLIALAGHGMAGAFDSSVSQAERSGRMYEAAVSLALLPLVTASVGQRGLVAKQFELYQEDQAIDVRLGLTPLPGGAGVGVSAPLP